MTQKYKYKIQILCSPPVFSLSFTLSTSFVHHRRNCILADEMGLGKTIQSITFLYEVYLKGVEGPFLVIAPLSTIPNWEREFRTWTELNAVVYHGSQASRKTIQAYEMYYRDAQVNGMRRGFTFLFTRKRKERNFILKNTQIFILTLSLRLTTIQFQTQKGTSVLTKLLKRVVGLFAL